MKLGIFLFKLNLKLVYFFMKIIPINKKKIVFISRQNDKPSLDFLMLKDKLERKYKVVMLTRKMEGGLVNYIKYYFHLYAQMYHLATSKVCVLDSYSIPACILKHKKKLVIIQIWHSMGAIKKFGYQTLDKSGGRGSLVAHSMKMHNNYDYIVSGSEMMIPYFSEAFNTSKDKFIVNGSPKIDYLLKNKKRFNREVKSIYPELKNKKNILYVPTFRNNEDIKLDDLIKSINYDKYNLIVKLHNRSNTLITDKRVLTCPKISSLKLLSVADYVITDYSGISIEASAIDIPIFLYLYDYDEYIENNGLNIDLFEELKPYAFKDAGDLIKCLSKEKYNINVVLKYKERYLDPGMGKYTDKLVSFINDKMECDKSE